MFLARQMHFISLLTECCTKYLYFCCVLTLAVAEVWGMIDRPRPHRLKFHIWFPPRGAQRRRHREVNESRCALRAESAASYQTPSDASPSWRLAGLPDVQMLRTAWLWCENVINEITNDLLLIRCVHNLDKGSLYFIYNFARSDVKKKKKVSYTT